MSTFQFLNFLFLNAIALVLLSYYWSFWTYKLFKPFRWLDFVKEKLLSPGLLRLERREREKVWFYLLWLQLERINKHQISGALAEVGVYKGASALIMRQTLPDRELHLFDTFSGHPAEMIHEHFDSRERIGRANYANCSVDEVRAMLNEPHTFLHKGVFPHTANAVQGQAFAFVHLDADLYQTTIDGLRFFYPLLVPGGTMVVENYNHNWPGVTVAVDEFAREIPEVFVEMPNQYGAVVLIKNQEK